MASQRVTIIRAYRSLYRAGLHAVQYSGPARYILKDTLQKAFRSASAKEFNPRRIGNTLLFLENAAKYRGIEHKILKNLIHVRWWERQHAKGRFMAVSMAPWNSEIRKEGYENYNNILKLLNDNLGTCLR